MEAGHGRCHHMATLNPEAYPFMRLDEVLFKQPHLAYLLRTHEEDSAYNQWEVEPLLGPTVSAAYAPNRILQGDFLVASKIVGSGEKCYMNIVLPERIAEYHFRLRDGRIARARGRRTDAGTVIPSVAIEAIGTYTLYLAKERIEEGIDVLRSGLGQAQEKGPIALDLAYLLRDAGRYQESIEAFTTAISLLAVDRFTQGIYYRERAALHEKLGNIQEAASDRVLADSLQVKSTRPR